MKSFSELLSDHVRRVGVSDAELARTLGVRRQTIFRWREGLTQRPRHREDVLRLAAKLRLTPTERDELLLAAGFAPEETDAQVVAGMAAALEGQTDDAARESPVKSGWARWMVWGPAIALVLGLILLLAWPQSRWAAARRLGLPAPTPTLASTWPAAASADETLILVAEFANYGGEQIGYNVAGRIVEVLESALAETGLADVRLEPLPAVVSSPSEAQAMAQRLNASIIVWGEYDSGRVLAYVETPANNGTSREIRRLLDSPQALNTAINLDLPQEARWWTLLVLGQLSLYRSNPQQARAILQQALNDAPESEEARGTLYFYLGLAEEKMTEVNWDQVIAYYTKAIELHPGLISALNNRGVAYMRRDAAGDAARAVQDLREAVYRAPDFARAHLNLGLALLKLGPNRLTEALGYFMQAHQLAPDAVGPNNALCWNLTLADRVDEALPYCEKAAALDESGYSHDSRGLAYALLGRYDEAAADFRYFLERLQEQDPNAYEAFRDAREAWIEALEQGSNPFDESALQKLREE
ncbi:MAG: hypothetical protein GXP42_08195 [Chloroflexi bacterium]|nr:hypothetical protein [Chloroflexota bacterium]